MGTVLQEIEDRKRFLDEMEELGQGKKYRTVIATEISQVKWYTFTTEINIIKIIITLYFLLGNTSIQSTLIWLSGKTVLCE